MERVVVDAAWVEGIIRDFIEHSPENTLRNQANEKAFDAPLVGFSRGDDPLFEAYKEHVGYFHWTPIEIFRMTFAGTYAEAGALTVVSWILPKTLAIRRDNRKGTFYPSERWVRARVFGEETNNKLRKAVVQAFSDAGIEAVAPEISPSWKIEMSEKYGRSSTWSERHAAYASGLGTFGLSDGLITPRGKAMRTGSVVARVRIPPTPRPYTDHHAYCLFFSRGECGKCITRCPVGAISEAGHDKVKCRNHMVRTIQEYMNSRYGFEGYGCGLCQTGVPCESGIPVRSEA